MKKNNYKVMDKIVLSKAPMRISLAGGGTDIESYASKFGGAVIGFAINKYITNIVFPRSFDKKIYATWEYEDISSNIDGLKNIFGKVGLKKIGIYNDAQIATLSDAPSGTGLGGSGAFYVSLLNTIENGRLSVKDRIRIAEMASTIEMQDLLRPVGKQDHYLSALGGVQYLKFNKDMSVQVSKIKLQPKCLKYFSQNLMLFYTGQRRSASNILEKQSNSIKKNDNQIIELLHKIASIVDEMIKALKGDEPNIIGPLIGKHWEAKMNLNPNISKNEFNIIYNEVLTKGADGGKILGAGGGGFFLISTKEGYEENVRQFMSKKGMRELQFDIDFRGTENTYLNI